MISLNKIDLSFDSSVYVNMELPTDVLGIVREYSRPVFKHYQVYNTAVKVLGIYEGWDALKEKLHTDSERVIPLLLAYQDAFLERRKLDKELRDFLYRYELVNVDNLERIYQMKERIQKANAIEKAQFHLLCIRLYSN
jgi:hypothetical protein